MDIGLQRKIDRYLGALICRILSLLQRQGSTAPGPVEANAILVILLSEMGSWVLAYPMFQHVRRRFPTVQIHSQCDAIQRMADELTEVNPYEEISFKRKMPRTHEMGVKYCTHAACPVPSGIIKAIEVEAGLALPTDVTIKLSKTPKEE